MGEISKFNNAEFYTQLLKYNDLSYRRFSRLTNKQQLQLTEYGLLPDEVNMVLKLFHLFKSTRNTESIPFSINIQTLIYGQFYEWLTTVSDRGRLGKYVTSEQAVNELIFRGFKRLGTFRVKPKRSYVMTCKSLLGYHYIHPYEMGSNYNMMEGNKKLPNLWETFGKIGLSGYTRVIYPEMEMGNYPLITKEQAQQLKLNWEI